MIRIGFVLIVIASCARAAHGAVPQEIGYQGYLASTNGIPLDTVVAMTFSMYTDSTEGSLLWTETRPAITVANGLFNVRLGQVASLSDTVFNQENVWLGVSVGSDAEMDPRTRMISAPFAYRVGTVDGTSGGTIGGDIRISGKATFGPDNINAGAYAFVVGAQDTVMDGADFSIVLGQQNLSTGSHNVISGGGGNKSYGSTSTIGGGAFNQTGDTGGQNFGLYTTVGGGFRNIATGMLASTVAGGQYNSATRDNATVGGGRNNNATMENATVGGGRNNDATFENATVSGGYGNTASNAGSTVSGGRGNTAQGMYSVAAGGGPDAYAGTGGNSATGDFSAVGGGSGNTAYGMHSVVTGGGPNSLWGTDGNSATGDHSAVSGGSGNTAGGSHAVACGGLNNDADGSFSFAAGLFANATHNSAFVWGGGYDGEYPSFTNSFDSSTFTVRCAGGARFYTSYWDTSPGVYLSAGGGAWGSLCDIRQKRIHGEVNTSEVLQKISSLPLHRWSYKTQDESIQHIGPAAQDFRAVFGLGESDTTINTLDPDGVALAAIQGLYKEVLELRARIQSLEAGNQKAIREKQ